jgi:uncharacterized membrane protein
MAGIGFNLQKILDGDTYFASFKAYFYSAVISAGPWILSILTLFSLTYFAPVSINLYEIMYFRALVIYIFAFSLIVIGIFQFPLTRYIADKLFLGEKEALLPVFNASSLVILGIQSVIGGLYLYLSGSDFRIGVLAVLVYLAITMVWLCMIFLSALKEYRIIALAYLIGSVVAIVASLYLGKQMGLEGYLIGYLGGHLVIVALWSGRIFSEFRSKSSFDFQFLNFTRHNKILVWTGFLYALAIWIDKIVFWLSPQATAVAPLLRLMPIYDTATFMAYLTIIPSLCIFLIRIETDFYRSYRRFYMAILGRAVYSRIERAKQQINGSLRSGAGTLVVYQGIISLAAVVYAPDLACFLQIPVVEVPVFRIITVGAFLHSLFLMTLLILLYFDLKVPALFAVTVFCVTNLVFTWLTTWLTLPFFGYGYLLSCLVSLVVAFYLLDFNLKRLEYLTFATQPVGIHREEEVS